MWSTGIQREVPFGFTLDVTYVGRRGLYLQRERNINQLLPGTLQANPGVNIAALRPYQGYGAIRISENAGSSTYNSLQISADRRYTNGLKVGFAYTLGHSTDNASDKRNVLWNTYDDTNFEGNSSFDRRHVAEHLLHLRPAVLPRPGHVDRQDRSAAGRFRARRSSARGTPFSVTPSNDIAGVGDGSNGQPVNLVGDVDGECQPVRSRPATATTRTSGSTPPRSRPGGRHVRQRAAQPDLQPGPAAVGHRAVQELRRWAARARCSSAPRCSTSSTTRT